MARIQPQCPAVSTRVLRNRWRQRNTMRTYDQGFQGLGSFDNGDSAGVCRATMEAVAWAYRRLVLSRLTLDRRRRAELNSGDEYDTNFSWYANCPSPGTVDDRSLPTAKTVVIRPPGSAFQTPTEQEWGSLMQAAPQRGSSTFCVDDVLVYAFLRYVRFSLLA